MRRIFILFSASCLSAQSLTDDLRKRLVTFEEHWHVFVMDYAGCREVRKTLSEDNCNFTDSRINYSEWQKSREAAKKLFDLK
jgi:hypothetical protein